MEAIGGGSLDLPFLNQPKRRSTGEWGGVFLRVRHSHADVRARICSRDDAPCQSPANMQKFLPIRARFALPSNPVGRWFWIDQPDGKD